MNKRVLATVATVAVLTSPLLVGCGSGSEPQSGTGTSVTPPATAPVAPRTTAQTSAPPSSDPPTSSPPTTTPPTTTPPTTTPPTTTPPTTTPTQDQDQRSAQVQTAAKTFMTTALTLGYPDRDVSTYLDRLKPLMTADGFAEVKKAADGDSSLKQALQKLTAERSRSAPQLGSKVSVSFSGADQAKASLEFKVATQVRDGATWKTTKTSTSDTAGLQLVRTDGAWLVDKTM